MDQTSRNTLSFCIEFIKNNYNEHSQVSMCLVWIKQANDILDKETELSSAGFVQSELAAIEKYLTGKDKSSTTADIDSKVKMIETLLEDA